MCLGDEFKSSFVLEFNYFKWSYWHWSRITAVFGDFKSNRRFIVQFITFCGNSCSRCNFNSFIKKLCNPIEHDAFYIQWRRWIYFYNNYYERESIYIKNVCRCKYFYGFNESFDKLLNNYSKRRKVSINQRNDRISCFFCGRQYLLNNCSNEFLFDFFFGLKYILDNQRYDQLLYEKYYRRHILNAFWYEPICHEFIIDLDSFKLSAC